MYRFPYIYLFNLILSIVFVGTPLKSHAQTTLSSSPLELGGLSLSEIGKIYEEALSELLKNHAALENRNLTPIEVEYLEEIYTYFSEHREEWSLISNPEVKAHLQSVSKRWDPRHTYRWTNPKTTSDFLTMLHLNAPSPLGFYGLRVAQKVFQKEYPARFTKRYVTHLLDRIRAFNSHFLRAGQVEIEDQVQWLKAIDELNDVADRVESNWTPSELEAMHALRGDMQADIDEQFRFSLRESMKSSKSPILNLKLYETLNNPELRESLIKVLREQFTSFFALNPSKIDLERYLFVILKPEELPLLMQAGSATDTPVGLMLNLAQTGKAAKLLLIDYLSARETLSSEETAKVMEAFPTIEVEFSIRKSSASEFSFQRRTVPASRICMKMVTFFNLTRLQRSMGASH